MYLDFHLKENYYIHYSEKNTTHKPGSFRVNTPLYKYFGFIGTHMQNKLRLFKWHAKFPSPLDSNAHLCSNMQTYKQRKQSAPISSECQ